MMVRPFILRHPEKRDRILTPEELRGVWKDGKLEPADIVVDLRTGSQFPAFALMEMQKLDSGIGSRRPQPKRPEDENSGLY